MAARGCAAASGRCCGCWKVWRRREWIHAAGARGRSAVSTPRGKKAGAWSRWGWRACIPWPGHYDMLHAHDGHGHTFGGDRGAGQAGGFAPGGVSRAVAAEILARAALSGGIGIRETRAPWRAAWPEEKISVVYDGVPLLEPSRGALVMAPASDDPQKGRALALEAARMAGVDLQLSDDLDASPARGRVFRLHHP